MDREEFARVLAGDWDNIAEEREDTPVEVVRGDARYQDADLIQDLVRIWIEDSRIRWCRTRQYNYDLAVRQLSPLLEDLKLSDWNSRAILRIRLAVQSWDYSPYWRNFLRDVVRGFSAWLSQVDLAPKDYSQSWRPLLVRDSDRKRIYRHFSHEEIERLVGAISRDSVKRFTWAAVYTGLRKSNLYPPAFVWRNVTEDWVYQIPSKEFKQKRPYSIPICAKLQGILGPRGNPEDPVILDLPSRTNIVRCLKRAAEKAGLRPREVYPHNFRRTFLFWLKLAGVSREEAQELLGSKSDTMLLDAYWPRQEISEKRGLVERI